MEERIFAIGDIHGHYARLRELMGRLPLQESDTLVFLGDYIDRGPATREVLDYLIELQARHKDIVFLMGNHEYMLLEYARTGDSGLLQTLRMLGVEATLESYGGAAMRTLRDLSFMPEAHVAFLKDLHTFHRQAGYLFLHGGLPHGCQPEDCPLEQMLSMRGTFLSDPWEGPEIIVFGHTAFQTPYVGEGKIGIDTGVEKGNLLTAVELPRLHFYHS